MRKAIISVGREENMRKFGTFIKFVLGENRQAFSESLANYSECKQEFLCIAVSKGNGEKSWNQLNKRQVDSLTGEPTQNRPPHNPS